jgi:ribosomal protein S18 acetylase RimI-like enzyme
MDGDTPVAAAALYTNGIFGSMVIAGTQAEHRGKGAQSALLAKRIEAAKASGCKYISTETAEEKPGKGVQSYRNMKRFGFEVAYLRPNYIWTL